MVRASTTMVMPRSAVLYAKPLPECAFLVEAAARAPTKTGAWGEGRAGSLLAVFAELEARDRGLRGMEEA
jgi:phytoene synthase